MKKLLLSLGTVASVAAPVTAVVACGDKETAVTFKTARLQTVGDIAAIEGLTNLVSDNKEWDMFFPGGTVETKYDGHFVENIKDSQIITQENKDKLLELISAYDSEKDAFYTMKFALTSLTSKQLNLAILGWSGTGYKFIGKEPNPMPTGDALKVAQLKDFISASALDPKTAVEGFTVKFTDKVPAYFDKAKVSGAATVDLATKNIVPSATTTPAPLWKFASDAVGGETTLKYLLQKQGWTFDGKEIDTKAAEFAVDKNGPFAKERVAKQIKVFDGKKYLWHEIDHNIFGKTSVQFYTATPKHAKTYLFPYQEIVDFAEGKSDSFTWREINTTSKDWPSANDLVNLGSYIQDGQKFEYNTGREMTLDLSETGEANQQKPFVIVDVKDIKRDKLLELLKSGTEYGLTHK